VEITLKSNIALREKDMEKIRTDLYTALRDVDFRPKRTNITIDPEECNRAYVKWLARQWNDIGLIPAKVIVPEIDFKAFSKEDLKGCRSVNFAAEYANRARRAYEEAPLNIFISSLESQAKTLSESKCGRRFIDQRLGKIAVSSIAINIKKNSLNFNAPSYKIYTSDKYLTVDDFKVSEDELVRNGTLMLLAHTPRLPSKTTGKFPIDPIPDFPRYQQAIRPLVSFGGSLVGYPDLHSFGPEIKKIDGIEQFIVPELGIFLAEVSLVLEFIATFSDLSCAYYDFIDKIKEHERAREDEQAGR
jgi:hypothetical protein